MDTYLSYKATIWFSIPVDEEDIPKIIDKIEKGYLPSELYNDSDELYLGQCEPEYETEEFMRPCENDGQSTIEIYNDDNMIWDNSYESEVKRKRDERSI